MHSSFRRVSFDLIAYVLSALAAQPPPPGLDACARPAARVGPLARLASPRLRSQARAVRTLPRPAPTGCDRNAGQIRALGIGRCHARIPRRSSL